MSQPLLTVEGLRKAYPGVVANSDTNPYVSSALTFSLSAGLRVSERWTLEWRHFSNAGLEQPNLGQDILLFRADFGNVAR